jgi:hypothetical protein
MKNREGVWIEGKLLPKVGTRINITSNSLGAGVVVGYYIDCGYLMLQVVPDISPDWRIKVLEGCFSYVKDKLLIPYIIDGTEFEHIDSVENDRQNIIAQITDCAALNEVITHAKKIVKRPEIIEEKYNVVLEALEDLANYVRTAELK